MMLSEYVWVEYHSVAWSMLVETGWITMYSESLPDGTRMARMIREHGRYGSA